MIIFQPEIQHSIILRYFLLVYSFVLLSPGKEQSHQYKVADVSNVQVLSRNAVILCTFNEDFVGGLFFNILTGASITNVNRQESGEVRVAAEKDSTIRKCLFFRE